jgi:hypothetical protein
LLELTLTRVGCEHIVYLLEELGQTEAANELMEYNTSAGRMKITNETVIKVTEAKIPQKGSLYYDMVQKPRGKCIIINNLNDSVFNESQRFQSIFEQLYFDVEPINSTINMTSEQIRTKLKSLAKDRKSLAKTEAFVLMIISHGQNEQVIGVDFLNKLDQNDTISISDIIDIFSEKNCPHLRQSPKLFFFNCCRISRLS